MSDPRIRPEGVKAMTNGTYVVDIEMEFTFGADGSVTITDKANGPVGDACAALHHAALSEIGMLIIEARNTDAYERKPDDPSKGVNTTRTAGTAKT